MTSHTLFVDESGNFDTDRAKWVVSGVLVPGSPDAAERAVANALGPALHDHHERIAGPDALHLTDFRTPPSRAHRLAATTLEALTTISGVRVGAVRNRLGRVVGERSGPIGTYERSYRLMLLDLVCLLEASTPSDQAISNLHLVVATRTADGFREMTPLSALREDVLAQISDAVEAGLAARGLLESSSHRRLLHRRAKTSWGLAAADVVANTAHHETDRDGGDRALVDRFAGSLGFRIFDAFGGYDVRRARVAERDGDLPLALARWAAFNPASASARQDRTDALARLSAALFNLSDPVAPRVHLEAVIERLRLSETAPDALGKALRPLESAIASVHAEHGGPQRARLLFRLRSFSRDAAHRRADLAEAQRLDKAQATARLAVAAEPEGFPLVLDDDVRAVNLLTQSLDLPEALSAARAHHTLVAHYGEVWELLGHDDGPAAFAASRVYLRAAQTLARHLAFATPLAPQVEAAAMAVEAHGILDALPVPDAADDRSRLANDRVLVLLRAGRVAEALAVAGDIGPDANAYDLYYACRAAASALLSDPSAHRDRAQAVYDDACSSTSTFAPAFTPLQLAWRERALLAHLLGDRVGAAHALEEAATRTGNLGGNAPIKRVLGLVVKVYRDALSGRTVLPSAYADIQPNESGHAALVEAADRLVDSGLSPVEAVRATSPY